MEYDNAALYRILTDKDDALRLARLFLDKSTTELSELPSETRHFIRQAGDAHVTRSLEIISAYAESPLEKAFVASLFMMFLKNYDPFGIIVTPKMDDAQKDMADFRASIAGMLDTLVLRRDQGGDISPAALLADLDKAVESGAVPESQYSLQFHLIWYYHALRGLELQRALHLTPQAMIPNALSDGRAIRLDLMIWIPEYMGYRVAVECDSYQFHDNRETFDHDRARSRALQRRGFKVLQYSGGEIWRDPIRVSDDLYTHLTEERRRFLPASERDA